MDIACILLMVAVDGCLAVSPVADAPGSPSSIEKLGGKVVRDAKLPGNPVVAIDLTGCAASNDKLQFLGNFREARLLDL